MRWEGRDESKNVEDRRGSAMPVAGMAGGGLLFLIFTVVISMLLGSNPRQLIEQAGQQQQSQQNRMPPSAENDKDANLKKFVGVVLKDNEDIWTKLFREKLNARYEEPKLVIFSGAVRSACGEATAAVGPFYCPGDKNVYLDFDFFRTMEKDLGAKGEFAMAFVIAHEVGHHVQNLLGLSMKIQRMQAQASQTEANQLSVRLELQADYLAGVWAHHAQQMKGILEREISGTRSIPHNESVTTCSRRRPLGGSAKRPSPTASAAAREYWFTQGLKSGDLEGMMKTFELPFSQLDPKTMR